MVRVAAQDHDTRTHPPGGVTLADEVVGRGPCGARAAPGEANVHRRLLSAKAGNQRPLERHEVGDHRDGLGRRGVRVRPARELVEVVADAGNLTVPLALDVRRHRGPGPRPRHGPPQQDGQRHAGRHRLGAPGGELGRRQADVDPHGAALSHGRTVAGVRGAAPPVRTLLSQQRGRQGVRRGAQHPLASPTVRTVGRLAPVP